MSRARRSKVKAALRHRGQVAGFIAEVCKATRQGRHGYYQPAWDGTGAKPARVPFAEGFDVHAVREAAAVMFGEASGELYCGVEASMVGELRWRARLAQRVLDALEGQPSECQEFGCFGSGKQNVATWQEWTPENPMGLYRRTCVGCQGTGHNLRGRLPPLEVTPQLLRRLTEGEGGFYDDQMAPWLVSLGDLRGSALACHGETASEQACALELLGPGGVDYRTRVAPRGEHRRPLMAPRRPDQWRSWSLDERITARGRFDTTPRSRQPGWQRGEQRHADQRRARRAAA